MSVERGRSAGQLEQPLIVVQDGFRPRVEHGHLGFAHCAILTYHARWYWKGIFPRPQLPGSVSGRLVSAMMRGQ